MIEVRVGQVWKDNDPRAKGRSFRIKEVFLRAGEKHAICATLGPDGSETHRRTIRVERLLKGRATKKGYTLVSEPEMPVASMLAGISPADATHIADKPEEQVPPPPGSESDRPTAPGLPAAPESHA